MRWLFEKKIIRSAKNGPITLDRFFNRVVVRAGGVQQTGNELNAVWRQACKKIEHAIAKKPVILMLGLGAGGAVKDLYTLFPGSHITAVEYDPEMITLTRRLWLCKPFPLPRILEGDAEHITELAQERFDLIVVDLFHGSAVSPLISQEKFLSNLKTRLSPTGIILINVFREPQTLETAHNIFKHSAHWKFASNTVGAFWEDVVKRQNM
jgi:spermidine synthase